MSDSQVKQVACEKKAAEDKLESKRDFSFKGLDTVLEFHQQYLVDASLIKRFYSRYSAASTAWMAGGMALDGEQQWPHGKFHKHFTETRLSSTSLKNLMSSCENLAWHAVDMLTALDRVSGGATIMLHFDGKLRPGAPAAPEALRPPIVYFTPFIPQEVSGGDATIARLTQMFVECIALPTAQRWEGAMEQIGVRLGADMMTGFDRPYRAKTYSYENPPPLIPSPISPKSSTYLIPGRPIGAVEKAIEYFHPDATYASDAVLQSPVYKNLQAEYEELQAECEDLDKQLVESRARTAYLEKQLEAQKSMLGQLSNFHKRASELLENLAMVRDLSRLSEELEDMEETRAGNSESPISSVTSENSSEAVSDVSMSIYDEVLDSPLRRAIRLPEQPAPPRHALPLRHTPLWDLVRPFGLASEAVIGEQLTESQDRLAEAHVRDIFREAEHDEWYSLLRRYTYGESRTALRELVEAMHRDSGLEFDEERCIKE